MVTFSFTTTASAIPVASDNATSGTLKYPVIPEAMHAVEVSLCDYDGLPIAAKRE